MQHDILTEINRLMDQLKDEKPTDDRYKILVARIDDLIVAESKLRALLQEEEPEVEDPVMWRLLNNGPLVSAVGSLGLGVSILFHERLGIVTSKAFSLIRFK